MIWHDVFKSLPNELGLYLVRYGIKRTDGRRDKRTKAATLRSVLYSPRTKRFLDGRQGEDWKIFYWAEPRIDPMTWETLERNGR